MKIYLMRHGEAVLSAPTDAERPLSDEGRAEVAGIANQLEGVQLDLVWVSPLLRAEQTWSILSEKVQAKTVKHQAPVKPSADPQAVLDALVKETVDSLMIVTHQPFVGRMASLCVDGDPVEQALCTAGVFEIETEVAASGCGQYVRILTP